MPQVGSGVVGASGRVQGHGEVVQGDGVVPFLAEIPVDGGGLPVKRGRVVRTTEVLIGLAGTIPGEGLAPAVADLSVHHPGPVA